MLRKSKANKIIKKQRWRVRGRDEPRQDPSHPCTFAAIVAAAAAAAHRQGKLLVL